MRIFVDWPWSDDVVYYGAPFRAYIHTKRWLYIVGARSQSWSPMYGYGDDWQFITRHPLNSCHVFLEPTVRCPLEAGHQGRHWNWMKGWKQS